MKMDYDNDAHGDDGAGADADGVADDVASATNNKKTAKITIMVIIVLLSMIRILC